MTSFFLEYYNIDDTLSYVMTDSTWILCCYSTMLRYFRVCNKNQLFFLYHPSEQQYLLQ